MPPCSAGARSVQTRRKAQQQRDLPRDRIDSVCRGALDKDLRAGLEAGLADRRSNWAGAVQKTTKFNALTAITKQADHAIKNRRIAEAMETRRIVQARRIEEDQKRRDFAEHVRNQVAVARITGTAAMETSAAGAAIAKKTFNPLRFQGVARRFYQSPKVEQFVAGLIMLNFLSNVLEKELDPQGTNYPMLWRVCENIFNSIFLFELIINMYAHWFCEFWVSAWNIFDFIVVCVGCVNFVIRMQGPLRLLRTLRAFRVFRLFRRIEELNKILVMITSAIPGVFNAFLVMVLAISIYALIAVELFSTFAMRSEVDNSSGTEELITCMYKNINGDVIHSESGRGLCLGAEYYGTFTRAWFSLFQVRRRQRPLVARWCL